jgi:Family of unknown function (DUF6090)
MIKFFRKIRYDLMEKSKTGMYFKYAIGEIVLVVIGILIALSINNMNEQRKFNRLKTVYIERLIADLKQDTTNIRVLVEDVTNRQEIIKTVVNDIDYEISTTILIKSIEDYFRRGWNMLEFTASMNTYSDLSQTGNMNVFRNTTLTKNIKQYYVNTENELKGQSINKDWIVPLDVALAKETSTFNFDPNTKELFKNDDPQIALKDLINQKTMLKRNAAGHFWFNKSLINGSQDLSALAQALIAELQQELNKN